MTKDRDLKKIIRTEAERSGEPYARVRQRVVRSDPSMSLADLWSRWFRDLAAVDEPIKLVRLATGYLVGLENVIDQAAVMAVRAGYSKAAVRAAVRDRPTLQTVTSPRTARIPAARVGVARPPAFPRDAADHWAQAVLDADPYQVCVAGGELRDYLRAMILSGLSWCRRTGVSHQDIAEAQAVRGRSSRRRFLWKPDLTELQEFPLAPPLPSG